MTKAFITVIVLAIISSCTKKGDDLVSPILSDQSLVVNVNGVKHTYTYVSMDLKFVYASFSLGKYTLTSADYTDINNKNGFSVSESNKIGNSYIASYTNISKPLYPDLTDIWNQSNPISDSVKWNYTIMNGVQHKVTTRTFDTFKNS